MINPIIKSFIKITILTLFFFALFYMWRQFLYAWWWDNTKNTSNTDTFESIDNIWLSEAWVALNINVWTKFYEWRTNYESDAHYNWIVSISTILYDRNKTNEKLITNNIESIRDYINVAKIDLKSYLDSSSDRADNYDSLMTQFKLRYKVWYANSKNLETQLNLIWNYIKELDTSIENIKSSMKTNMKNYYAKWLNKNINDYIVLKNEVTLMKVYYLFCSRFLAYYNFLNWYNKEVITTLRLNKDSIIKNTYVVIPENWSELISKLNLIYNQADLPENNITNTSNTNSENIDTKNTITSESSNFYFDTDSPFNAPWNWIFWDPFNMKDTNYETIKQTWNIYYWTLTNHKK